MQEIPLTQHKFAQVDDEDYYWLSQYKWYATNRKHTWYAVRNAMKSDGSGTIAYMHTEIMETVPEGFEIDHIDRDGLNNQKSNLRVCVHSDNSHNQNKKRTNTSGYKGVRFHKLSGKWEAYIRINYIQKHIGLYSTPILAAHAYDDIAKELFGVFAKLNFDE